MTGPIQCRLDIRTRDGCLRLCEQARIERCYRLTVGKFESVLREVAVTLSAVAGADPDWIRCRVVVRDRNNLVVRAESEGRYLTACVTRAFVRVERAMRRRSSGARQRLATGPRAAV